MAHKDFENFRYNPVYSIVVDDKTFLKNKYNLKIIYADKGKLYKFKRSYSEISQLYYIYTLYKKGIITSDYIGLNHYRRYFNFTDNIPDIDEIFRNHDVILNRPRHFIKGMKDQYCYWHICQNYDELINIIKDIRPDYYETALKTIYLQEVNICNLFIMKKKDFFDYCKFMFDILFEFDRRHNFTSDDDVLKYIKNYYSLNKNSIRENFQGILYQSRLESFLSERIGNIYYYKNFKHAKLFDHGNYKNENKSITFYSNYLKVDDNQFTLKIIIKKINLINIIIFCFLIFLNVLNIF